MKQGDIKSRLFILSCKYTAACDLSVKPWAHTAWLWEHLPPVTFIYSHSPTLTSLTFIFSTLLSHSLFFFFLLSPFQALSPFLSLSLFLSFLLPVPVRSQIASCHADYIIGNMSRELLTA